MADETPRGLSRVAEEFCQLERRRRAGALGSGELNRYHQMFEQLSDLLAGGLRRRRINAREFLRVPVAMHVGIAALGGTRRAACREFGGGGCRIAYPEALHEGDVLVLESVDLAGQMRPFAVRAIVAWAKDGELGVRFDLRSDEARDQIDRVFLQVLGLFLNPPAPAAVAASEASARPTA